VLQQAITSIWAAIVAFVNPQLAASLFTAALGALAGALTAKRIAERVKLREELTKEIRSVNVAINLASLTASMFLSLKGQHVKRMKETFDAKRAEFEQRLVDRGPFELPADFEGLALVSAPVEQLQAVVFDKLLSSAGRLIMLAPTLAQAVQTTNSVIAERNRLIEEFRANRRHGDNAQLLQFYFGVRDQHGNIDNRFGNSIEQLYRCTDDCIAFAEMLIGDLGTHGDGLKKRFDKLFRTKAPMIHKPLFDKAEQRALLPDANQYADWDTMFVKPRPEPSWASRWQRRLVTPLVVRYRLISRRLRSRARSRDCQDVFFRFSFSFLATTWPSIYP
jgi:hypothetical protein